MAIADILNKGVKVILDKERTLMYPMTAMGYLADVYGSVGEAFEAFAKVMPSSEAGKKTWKLTASIITTLNHFVVAGLRAEDPSITFEEVGTILNMANMPSAIAAVGETIRTWMPIPTKPAIEGLKEGADPSLPRPE